MLPFKMFSKLVLLKPKLKLLSWNYKQKKAELKRNANADRGHVRRSKKFRRNGWNVMQTWCLRQGSPSVRGPKNEAHCISSLSRKPLPGTKNKRMEDLGQRKCKRHSPQPNQIEFDKENLLKEVKNMKDNEKVRKDTVHRRYQFSNGQLKIIIKRDK